MRFPLGILLVCFLIGCNLKTEQETNVRYKTLKDNEIAESDLEIPGSEKDSFIEPEINIDEEYMECFVVIGDTSQSYYTLLKQLTLTSRKSGIGIDSLGRFYNQEKGVLQLPDNDLDEIYAGEYYPRRMPGDFLSVEYANFYLDSVGDKLMATVAGIYEKKVDAEKRLAEIRRYNKRACLVESSLYMGCMH